jgi:hypothetical protein
VKASGPELNPDTTRLFRPEIVAMQRAVGQFVAHAPVLVDVYDDGAWRAAHRTTTVTCRSSLASDPTLGCWQPWPNSTRADTVPVADAPVAAVRSEPISVDGHHVIADGLVVPDCSTAARPNSPTGAHRAAGDCAVTRWRTGTCVDNLLP